MANDDNKPKPKRQLKPGAQTIRERAEQTASKLEAQKQKQAKKSQKTQNKVLSVIAIPLKFIWRPIRWLGKHLIPRYFKNAFIELKLTTWPDRKQSRQLTTAVILFAIIFGAFVGILDYGLGKLFKEILVK